jgi:hypothetical protein
MADTKKQKHEEALKILNQEKAKEHLNDLRKDKEKREKDTDDLKWRSYMKNIID